MRLYPKIILWPFQKFHSSSWKYNPIAMTIYFTIIEFLKWCYQLGRGSFLVYSDPKPAQFRYQHTYIEIFADQKIHLCGFSEFIYIIQPVISSVQFSRSVMSNSLWPHELQASLSITNSWSSPKLMSIESVMPPNHLILCRPLILLPSIFPSIRVFSNESAHHKV